MAGDYDIGSLVLSRAPDLHFTRQGRLSGARYVVSDLRRGKHASVRPDVYRLLGAIDGRRSLGAIYARGEPDLPPRDGAARAVLQLHNSGLIDVLNGQLPPAPPAPSAPPEGKLTSWRRNLIDLGPLLPQLDRLIGWMFTKRGLQLWAVVGAIALWRLADNWSPDAAGLEWLQQMSVGQAFGLYLLFLLLKAVHEIGHAVAYKRMAAGEGIAVGSVRAGIALLFLVPFPFTDVTGAWRLASRWRRAVVGAAGMYVESWPAILAAILWTVADDPLVKTAASQVAAVAGITTILFNLNPLGRMDGYYIFSDLLDRPNLSRQAAQQAMALGARLIGALPAERAPIQWPLFFYWCGAMLFRLGIYTGLFLTAVHYGALAAGLALLLAASLLAVRPLIGSLRWLVAVGDDPARTRRCLRLVAGAAILLLALPLPSPIRLDGVVQKSTIRMIYPPRGARVVRQGGRLALAAEDARLELRAKQAQHDAAVTRWQRALLDDTGDARAAAEEAASTDRQVASLRQAAADLAGAMASPGFQPLAAGDYEGSVVALGAQPIAVALPSEGYVIQAVAPDGDRGGLAAGAIGWARPVGRPEARFRVKLRSIEPSVADDLPSSALGRAGGGHFAVDPRDTRGRRAAEPLMAAVVEPVGQPPALRHGDRIEVRLQGPLRPLAYQWGRRLLRALDVPLFG